MNSDFDLAPGGSLRPEPSPLADAARGDPVLVVRDPGFARLSPTSFSLGSVPDDPSGRVEILFHRLAARVVAQRLGAAADGARPVVGRDLRMEVCELGAVELSPQALLRLRQEIDRHLGDAPPRLQPAPDAVAQQLLASTRSELSAVQDALGEKIDDLARRVDGWGGRMAAVRADLARDLEQLVRLLWPKDRLRK